LEEFAQLSQTLDHTTTWTLVGMHSDAGNISGGYGYNILQRLTLLQGQESRKHYYVEVIRGGGRWEFSAIHCRGKKSIKSIFSDPQIS
jgi:hypothetical protein